MVVEICIMSTTRSKEGGPIDSLWYRMVGIDLEKVVLREKVVHGRTMVCVASFVP